MGINSNEPSAKSGPSIPPEPVSMPTRNKTTLLELGVLRRLRGASAFTQIVKKAVHAVVPPMVAERRLREINQGLRPEETLPTVTHYQGRVPTGSALVFNILVPGCPISFAAVTVAIHRLLIRTS
jgi:hypothetical protein